MHASRPPQRVSDPLARSNTEITTHLDPGWSDRALREEVQQAFTSLPKELSPRWLYDQRGSELFDRITELDVYYPTEAERLLLAQHADAIVSMVGVDTVIELGSGTSDKTRILLDTFVGDGQLKRFVPFDVSESMLTSALALLGDRYPGVSITPVAGDFNLHLDQLPDAESRMLVFLGGTIGNFYPAERETFLRSVAAVLNPGEWFLLGADLVKDPARILAAYDDDEGITAEFILNVLHVLNRELDADLPVEDFEYVVTWEADDERIDMRVRAKTDIRSTIGALDLAVAFGEGEELRVEISTKFRPPVLAAELEGVGLCLRHQFLADDDEFGLFLAQRA